MISYGSEAAFFYCCCEWFDWKRNECGGRRMISMEMKAPDKKRKQRMHLMRNESSKHDQWKRKTRISENRTTKAVATLIRIRIIQRAMHNGSRREKRRERSTFQ